jgi:hypothetical protein
MLHENRNQPVEDGLCCLGSPFEAIKVARLEMLCKTIIGFSPELARVPNVATASEAGNEGFVS